MVFDGSTDMRTFVRRFGGSDSYEIILKIKIIVLNILVP